MCRGQDYCTELDKDTSNWNKQSLLDNPKWFNSQIDIFIEAVKLFVIYNDKQGCLNLLSTLRNDEMQDWFIEHGQMSGRHRKNTLNIQKPPIIDESLRDAIRSPKKYQKAVFKRDGYRCRYCGIRLLSQKFVKEFSKKLNSNLFQRGKTNKSTNGLILNFWPVADHVFPWNMGGQTNESNLVSSCSSCNYGKDGYTCEQLGIENPFDREPIVDNWDGLESYIDELKTSL